MNEATNCRQRIVSAVQVFLSFSLQPKRLSLLANTTGHFDFERDLQLLRKFASMISILGEWREKSPNDLAAYFERELKEKDLNLFWRERGSRITQKPLQVGPPLIHWLARARTSTKHYIRNVNFKLGRKRFYQLHLNYLELLRRRYQTLRTCF